MKKIAIAALLASALTWSWLQVLIFVVLIFIKTRFLAGFYILNLGKSHEI